MRQLKISKLVLLLFLFTFVANAQKKADSLFKPHVYLYAGGFAPNVTTSLRLDSKTAHVGGIISLEDNLNFDEQPKLFRADAVAHLGKRSTIALTYLSINRSRSLSLEEDLHYYDTVFKMGAKASMYFNSNYFGLSYRYSIFSKQNWNAGLSIGARVLTVSSGFSASSSGGESYSTSSSYIVPAGLIGVHGSAYLTKRLQCRYTWEYLKLNYQGLDIFVFDSNVALEYYIIKNLGIGGSYTNVAYILKDVPYSPEFEGELKYTWYGFSLFVAARF